MPVTRTSLWFDTQALEAAEYYVSIFPDSTVSDISYWGPENPERDGTPLEVLFDLDGRAFSAINGGPDFTFNEAISIQVYCADQAEVDYYWERLGRGGKEVQCGWLTDRYGLSWQVIPQRLSELMTDPDRERVQRVKQAMYAMVKLDIAGLEAAAAGP
ncbi:MULTISPECIES: VOC family protein [Mycobacteriaceae]|uniref:VOC family protein n=3 Tax=Mycobacteriaceae TaxID=1762 RepID=A0ABX3RKK4_MYCAL|nr:MULTISPECIES: VOC family protein [Mycobacteriaceae]OQZ94631.1 VOC family protein [Mycolicibacter algericus DSM 45454]BBX11419.1 putative 3-demethylubiquinone-9 3-methyltransferase [Mycobacterium novum]GFG84342.1 putative 3-demethylubiquinone-9 3-methyltransferase [Mycolicibacter algericus]